MWLVGVFLLTVVTAEVYFKETFDEFPGDWVVSDWKKSSGEAGEFDHSAGEWYGDEQMDLGLRTSKDARFYAISKKIADSFSNKGKDLVLQFQVKHAQDIDCGGGYLKFFPEGLDQEHMHGDAKYNIMFGPDICGSGTKKVHVIFEYKGENQLIKKTIMPETNQLSHVYTLIVKPDQSYEVRIDGDKKESGNLKDDWDFLEPKKIKDPEQSKPDDWIDDAKMDDPESVKPEGWDDIPKEIDDPEAEKPDDWDDEADGEWEPPVIDNPDYKGEWKADRIDNPDYKGPWVHPEIDNPDFVDDDEIYAYESFGYVGVDIWQVKSGTIFDNIIITDDIEEAEAFMADTWGKTHEAEKEMFDAAEKKRRDEEEAQRKKDEEARKAEEEEEEEEEDEDEEESVPTPKEVSNTSI